MRSIWTAEKNFEDPWIGSPRLNRMGLHPLRIAVSDLCLGLRRRRVARPGATFVQALTREGVVVLENFLDPERYAALATEVASTCERLRTEHPYAAAMKIGYGARQPFPGGYDHHDGGTLSHYIDIVDSMAEATAFKRSRKLKKLSTYATGFAYRSGRCRIVETLHTGDLANPDVQAETHKDTFHSTVKFGYFLEDCPLENGPFAYSKGSHRMTLRRYLWEYARAVEATSGGSRRGSFRASDADLESMGLEPPAPLPVRGNTLVLADTRGFHRRTPGLPGSRRVAIHAVLRWDPFQLSPLGAAS